MKRWEHFLKTGEAFISSQSSTIFGGFLWASVLFCQEIIKSVSNYLTELSMIQWVCAFHV